MQESCLFLYVELLLQTDELENSLITLYSKDFRKVWHLTYMRNFHL